MTVHQPHIAIIGAGVIGLTAAVFLAESGYTVTVIAAHVPGDESIEYTSPWAGAHWRTHATAAETDLCNWDLQTFHYWSDLMIQPADPSLPSPCLKMQTSYHFWDIAAPPEEQLWWAPHVPGFALLSARDDEPVRSINAAIPKGEPTILSAARSRAMSVDAPRYLQYLLARAQKAGAVVFRSRLPVDGGWDKALGTAEGICRAMGGIRAQGVQVWVHATGIGAKALAGDEGVHPVKGQTVLVRGEAEAIRTRTGDGFQAYCIPRPGSGTTILGGTKEKGVWSAGVSEGTTRKILERCAYMVPELRTGRDGGFEVISVQCGHRPAREGGPRVEKEVVDGRRIVHAYGHAGAGYQNSIGSTRATVRLVEEFLREDRQGGMSANL